MGTSKETQRQSKLQLEALPKIEENLPHLIQALAEVLDGQGSSMFYDYSRRRRLSEIVRDLRIYVNMSGNQNVHCRGLLIVVEEFLQNFNNRAGTVAQAARPISSNELDKWLTDQRRLITPVMQRCQVPQIAAPAQHPHAG